MDLVVTDFEATCWDRDSTPRDQYAESVQKQEIIEIGSAIVAPKTMEVIHRASILVRPVFIPVLSPFCTELTGITQSMVDRGWPFVHALKSWETFFGTHLGDRAILASWGAWDRKILARNCEMHNVPNPFDRTPHFNIKNVVADRLFDGRRAGVKTRCQEMGLPFTGAHHRALDDVDNIVRILFEMCEREHLGLDELLGQEGIVE